MSRHQNAATTQQSYGWRPSQWALWKLGPRTAMTVLLIDLAGLGSITAGVLTAEAPTLRHWVLFGELCVAGLAHVALTRPAEERRRAQRIQQRKVEHVDLTSIWFASAALVLPSTLAVTLTMIVWGRLYLIARKPPGLWISTSSTVVMSVVGVGAARHLIGGPAWMTGTVGLTAAAGLQTAAVLLAATVVYFLAQAVPIGIYRGIRYGAWSLGETLGTGEDNALIVFTLFVAMGAALVTIIVPLGLIGVLAFAVWLTRNIGRIAALIAESEVLKISAFTDKLTNLLNRDGFEVSTAVALNVDKASGESTSVLMLDIDHFKAWNTRLGHFGADVVLQKVAGVLRQQTRQGDILARWGGEELTVVLPDTDVQVAVEIAERIRVAVAQLDTEISKPAGGGKVRLGQGDVPPCTISIGVATAPQHGTEVADLQKAADAALQKAKDNGRNQVIAAPGPLPVPIRTVTARTLPVVAVTGAGWTG
jgi:diguanylate cyclase (GGDEF)-like protein